MKEDVLQWVMVVGWLVQMWTSVEHPSSCSPGFSNKWGEVIDLCRTHLAGDSPAFGAWWRGLSPTLSHVPRYLPPLLDSAPASTSGFPPHQGVAVEPWEGILDPHISPCHPESP